MKDEFECCEDQGYTYIGLHDYYKQEHCCPLDSTHYSLGDGEDIVGCCTYHSDKNNDCCREKDHNGYPYTFNPETNTCKVELLPCPCEGCCDFNCCDELDFFMHRAFYDYYNQEYPNFMAFYKEWYTEFYSWWHSPNT